jgi:biopolymer transport protein ExbD
LEEIFKSRESRTAFVRGNDALEFQVVAHIIDIMRAAGVNTVGLLTPGLGKVTDSD